METKCTVKYCIIAEFTLGFSSPNFLYLSHMTLFRRCKYNTSVNNTTLYLCTKI